MSPSQRRQMPEYRSLRWVIPLSVEERLPELLDPLMVLGCELGQERDGEVELKIYLRGSACQESATVARRLEEAGGRAISDEVVPDRDWLEAYRSCMAPAGRVRLAIEPRSAFGSGSHESTQLVLLELEDLKIRDRDVLDLGAGSGILSLAADAMGAASVVGCDVDPEAVRIASATLKGQEWDAAPLYFVGSVSAIRRCSFDVILCNMISEHFIPMLSAMCHIVRPGGVVVLSGVLDNELETVRVELEAAGLVVESTRRLGEWLSLCAFRSRDDAH
jgi:ribosomal protein L11 methylase PrmA